VQQRKITENSKFQKQEKLFQNETLKVFKIQLNLNSPGGLTPG